MSGSGDKGGSENRSKTTVVVEGAPRTLHEESLDWEREHEPPPCAGPTGELPSQCAGWCEFAQRPLQPLRRPGTLAEGALISGRYELGPVLGRGGMGVVHEAFDRLHGRTVALKLMSREHAQQGSYVGRFESEGRAMARVRHPNLVELIDWGKCRGVPYLVMTHLSGGSLHDVLEQVPAKRLGAVRTLMILDAACAGVAALHRAEIVHNDLKAGNVFFAGDGRTVVGDLGMARPCGASCRAPLGRIEGTPGYIAPELVCGDSTRPAPTADVYALGVLAFKLLTGRLPFEGDSAAEIFRNHVDTPALRPSRFRKGLDPRLDEVVLSTLAKDPAKRPADAGELRRALQTLAPR